jgi:dimethylaniline monooxygenase (N-oxide forming)
MDGSVKPPGVAVLGTGPSGLAATKALVEHGLHPVVFEAAPQPFGMWAGPGRGAWSDFARTNISRYSCAFSDLAWPADAEVFPIRREVAAYLRRYAETFGLLRFARFGTRVDTVRANPDGGWEVGWHGPDGPGSEAFDHVVIATGFLSEPFRPAFPGLADFAGEVTHSAACDTKADMRSRFNGKRVLVVGAAFSGTEIAAELAPYAQVTVTLRHPMWFVPRWVAATDGGPNYPLDLVIYNRRRDNPLLHDPHVFLRRVGGDPGAASPELAFDRDRELPMAMIISDDFLDLVRSGAVAVKRSASLRFDAGGVTFADGTRQAFDAVVLCTGYTSSLPFFDRPVLDAIGFDGSDQLQPKLLHRTMFHPDLPGLAFVGHYRGPYVPVMELQARWLAAILAGELPMPDRVAMLAGIAEERALRTQQPRPQFPHGDFVAMADSLAREAGIFPELPPADPLLPRVTMGPLVPAQFRLSGPHATPELARALIAATPAPVIDDPPVAMRISAGRRVLDLLRGDWSIDRRIEPGGQFTGEASFTPRSIDSLLYKENGRVVLDNGTELDGGNSYVYALRNGDIEISFADGPSRGKQFIDISLAADDRNEFPIVSADRHLCRLDIYEAIFRLETADLFSMTYVVRGPKKGYVSRSAYRRLERDG